MKTEKPRIGPHVFTPIPEMRCTGCEMLKCRLVMSGRHPQYEYTCQHPKAQGQESDCGFIGDAPCETPDWCPELKRNKAETVNHDHACHCGTAALPHNTGEGTCVRRMTEAPIPLNNDFWFVDSETITGHTLREQRLYFEHPCGCWSRAPGTSISLPEET